MLLKVNFLGHETGYNTIEPIHSKIAPNHTILSSTGEVALIFHWRTQFLLKSVEKLHKNSKHFYDLLHKKKSWNWTPGDEGVFQQLKTALTSETELTIPNAKHPFSITVNASINGIGAVLFQLNEENEMKVISHISRTPNPQ